MRLLLFCNYSLLYGANRSMLTIANHLIDKGHDLMVILPAKGPIIRELEQKGINYKVIRFFPSYLYFKILFRHLLVPILFIYNILVVPRIIFFTKKFKPDLIYSNTSAENIGIVVSKILKIKHVSHIREFMSLDHGSFFVFGKRAKKRFINMSNGVIFVSKAVAGHVMMGANLMHDKHRVIYNGIANCNNLETESQFSGPIRIGSIGVLQESKGHHLLLEYFSRLTKINSNVELHIFGEGYNFYEKRLRQFIKENHLGGKVFIHGFVQNMDEIYKFVNVICIFSRSEGFGRVTAEAMFRRIPVIGLNRGGTQELIIHRKTGFLIDDYDSFYESLQSLFADSSLYNKIVNDAYKYAEINFSEKKYAENVEQFLSQIFHQL